MQAHTHAYIKKSTHIHVWISWYYAWILRKSLLNCSLLRTTKMKSVNILHVKNLCFFILSIHKNLDKNTLKLLFVNRPPIFYIDFFSKIQRGLFFGYI